MYYKLFSQKDIAYSPQRFFNRELSLLRFHERVLAESHNTSYPLLERLRFLSISGSNLDEFYMVRFAGLKAKRSDAESVSIDGISFKDQLAMAYPRLREFKQEQMRSWDILKRELHKEKIEVVGRKELDAGDLKQLEELFIREILPSLNVLDAAAEFPFLANLSFNMLLEIDEKKAVLALPKRVNRFIRVRADKDVFMAVEDVIELFLPKIAPQGKVRNLGFFTIIRDTLLNFEERADDLIASFEDVLKQRKQGAVVLLEAESDFDPLGLLYLAKQLKADDRDVVMSDFLGFRHFSQLILPQRKELLFKEYNARKPERIRDFNGDHFRAIAKKDMVIHHPYESYEVVVNFLKQAANDKHVTSIKQTIYRTNKESPIMYALMEAAKNGKDVTAVIELRARFDEEANYAWGQAMAKHGVKVVYGHPKYKFHGKISLVERKEKGKIRGYVHYGTGNYNPVTASIYTDLSFFTCDKALCADAEKVFSFLKTRQKPPELQKLTIAPFGLQEKIIALIDAEAALAQQGKPGYIWAKMNSLMDDKVIDAFYRASQAGVKIMLIVRGICSLRPGIKGLSENIRVKSIVGRFLEHSRIYCFGNGKKLPSKKARIFISSADLMRRNLVKRIETLVPIENPTVREQVLEQIMYANVKDNAGSWLLDPEMAYHRTTTRLKPFSAQEFFMNNPSLSGRGSARLKKQIKRKS